MSARAATARMSATPASARLDSPYCDEQHDEHEMAEQEGGEADDELVDRPASGPRHPARHSVRAITATTICSVGAPLTRARPMTSTVVSGFDHVSSAVVGRGCATTSWPSRPGRWRRGGDLHGAVRAATDDASTLHWASMAWVTPVTVSRTATAGVPFHVISAMMTWCRPSGQSNANEHGGGTRVDAARRWSRPPCVGGGSDRGARGRGLGWRRRRWHRPVACGLTVRSAGGGERSQAVRLVESRHGRGGAVDGTDGLRRGAAPAARRGRRWHRRRRRGHLLGGWVGDRRRSFGRSCCRSS